jgi:hypothetical protein
VRRKEEAIRHGGIWHGGRAAQSVDESQKRDRKNASGDQPGERFGHCPGDTAAYGRSVLFEKRCGHRQRALEREYLRGDIRGVRWRLVAAGPCSAGALWPRQRSHSSSRLCHWTASARWRTSSGLPGSSWRASRSSAQTADPRRRGAARLEGRPGRRRSRRRPGTLSCHVDSLQKCYPPKLAGSTDDPRSVSHA